MNTAPCPICTRPCNRAHSEIVGTDRPFFRDTHYCRTCDATFKKWRGE